VENEIENIGKR